MTTPGTGSTPDALPAANDDVAADVRLTRLLLAIGVYVIAAVLGWCMVGIAVAIWIFER